MLGNYEIKVSTSGMPQKVASGLDKVFGSMLGASYDFIAYLGSQVVNGTNHALLMKQTLVTGKDVENIVLVILNEKPGDKGGESLSVVEIRTLFSSGGALGGYTINPQINIPADAKAEFDKHFAGFTGANLEPFALLATQVVNGIAYVFAVTSTLVLSPACMERSNSKSVKLIKIYNKFDKVEMLDVLDGGKPGLGYSFSWM